MDFTLKTRDLNLLSSYLKYISIFFFFFFFFKERLGLKLTHKRITTKVVLPASKGKGAIQGEVKMCKEGESYDDKLLKSPKVRRYKVRNQRK